MIVALVAAFATAAFLLLWADLASAAPFLHPMAPLVIAASMAAASGLLPRSRGWTRVRSGPGPALLALTWGVCAMAIVGVARDRMQDRLSSAWADGARARLEERARTLQKGFNRLLGEMSGALGAVPGVLPDDRGALFDALERSLAGVRIPSDRLGLALYDGSGDLVAWAGSSAPLPEGLLADIGEASTFRAFDGAGAPRLYAIGPARADGSRLVTELSVASPTTLARAGTADVPDLGFLPGWRRAAPERVRFGGGSAGDADLARFFERQGDRHWGLLKGRPIETLSFPLRDPSGRQLADVSLTDRALESVASRRTSAARLAAAIVAVGTFLAILLGLLGKGVPRGVPTRLAATSLALWGVRVALVLTAAPADLPDHPLFDMSLFSATGLLGLLRTPIDLFLTALAVLGQVALVRAAVRRRFPPGGPAPPLAVRRAALAFAALIVTGSWPILHRVLDTLVLDARVDLSRLALDDRLLPRLAIQASVLAILAAMVLAAATALACAVRSSEWPRLAAWIDGGAAGGPPLPVRLGAVVFLLTLLYVPFLHHAYNRLRGEFIEHELMPDFITQSEGRARILREGLEAAARTEFAVTAAFAREAGGVASSVAFRLWSMTPLADRALASSLQLFDESGQLLGRFAVDLAPMLEIPFSAAAEAAGGEVVTVSPFQRASVRKTIIFGSRWVRPPRRPPMLIVMSVVDDYDNLPLLGSSSPFLSAVRGRGLSETNPELMRSRPLVAVFGPLLERVYASGGEIPPPGSELQRRLRAGGAAWSRSDVGDGQARILYAAAGDLVFAIAQPHPGPIGLLATFLRHLIQNALFLSLLLLALRGWRRGAPAHREIGARFYRRLLAVFLITALLPLLALAWFVARFSTREVHDQIVTAGLGSLQVARRVAEDYLTVVGPEEEPHLDDDVVFWLSQVVRHEISIFGRSDLLATSMREIYDSGLLNPRLPGGVYRSLLVDRDPFIVTSDVPGDFPPATINAVIRLDAAGSPGVISIPLSAQRRAAARRIEQVDDVILISTCLTVLLLALAAWVVARRVSEPIVHLAGAARRMAGGDLSARVRVAARDEIATLVDAFNRMAGSIEDQQDRLRRRRDFIEMVLKSATTGVVTIDADGSIITINPAAQRLISGSPDEPRASDDLSEKLRADPRLAPLAAELRRAQRSNDERGADLTLGRGEGERRIRAVFLPFAPEAGDRPGRIVLLEDVTEIVRSGRLAAWADMARRIAHEIKNPLTPMQLSVEHIRRIRRAKDARFDEILNECLENIQRQIGALRSIASEFSAYARLPQLRIEPTPVESLLDDALRPYAAAPPRNLRLERLVDPGLPPLHVDRAVIGRALVNLIENALHAMPGGGTLTVTARGADGAGGAGAVVIEVRDDGSGIDPDVMPRLFEPYFSTRSGGTGLGLAIARRAIEEHGGSVTIESRRGEGTVVRLRLPVTAPRGKAAS